MKALQKHGERWLVAATAGIAAAISLADLFDVLDQVPWITDHLPALTVLLVAGLLWQVGTAHAGRLEALEQEVHASTKLVRADIVARLSTVRAELDWRLDAIFGEHLSSLGGALQSAVTNREVVLTDVEAFRYFYRRALKAFPDGEIFATSLPLKQYFWSSRETSAEMERFVAGGGRMTRLFFVTDDEQLSSPETREILSQQQTAGIDVLVARTSDLPIRLVCLFALDIRNGYAWEIGVTAEGQISKVEATVDAERVRYYAQLKEQILNSGRVRRYEVTLSQNS